MSLYQVATYLPSLLVVHGLMLASRVVSFFLSIIVALQILHPVSQLIDGAGVVVRFQTSLLYNNCHQRQSFY